MARQVISTMLWLALVFLICRRVPAMERVAHLDLDKYFYQVPRAKSCINLDMTIEEFSVDGEQIYGFSEHLRAIRCFLDEEARSAEVSLSWPRKLVSRSDPRNLKYYLLERPAKSWAGYGTGDALHHAEHDYYGIGQNRPQPPRRYHVEEAPFTGTPLKLRTGSNYLLCFLVPGQVPVREEQCRGIMVEMRRWRWIWLQPYLEKLSDVSRLPTTFIHGYLAGSISRFSTATINTLKVKAPTPIRKVPEPPIKPVPPPPSGCVEEPFKPKPPKPPAPKLKPPVPAPSDKGSKSGASYYVEKVMERVPTFSLKKKAPTLGQKAKLKVKGAWAWLRMLPKRTKEVVGRGWSRVRKGFKGKGKDSKAIGWSNTKSIGTWFGSLGTPQRKKVSIRTNWSPILYFYKYLHSITTCIICFPLFDYLSVVASESGLGPLMGWLGLNGAHKIHGITHVSSDRPPRDEDVTKRTSSETVEKKGGIKESIVSLPNILHRGLKPDGGCDAPIPNNRDCYARSQTAVANVARYNDACRSFLCSFKSWLKSFVLVDRMMKSKFFDINNILQATTDPRSLLSCTSMRLIVFLLLLNLQVSLVIFLKNYF